MSRIVVSLFALLVLLPAAAAQSEGDKPAPAEKAKLSGFLKVEIVLDNESVFAGLIDKNRMVERVKRHRYVKLNDSQKDRFGSGIRLWFYDGLAGFLFFQYRHIDKIVIDHELSLKELEAVRAAGKAKREAREAAMKRKVQAKAVVKKKTDPKAGLDAKSRELLERWDPREGWTEEKYQAIQMRVIAEGYELSAEEKEWSRSYPDWLKALRASRAAAAKKPATGPAAKEVKKPAKAVLTSKKKAKKQSAPGLPIDLKR